jgi:succinate dehydrogenase / fumarate reductase cytochrome b subunit
MNERKHPVFLNPLQIALPVTATVSFAHRVSGVLLALAMPFLAYALSLSLEGPDEYSRLVGWLKGVPGKVALIALTWCFAHHTAAGIRHLLFDVGIGTDIHSARASAWAVHGFSLLALLVVAGVML